MTFLKSPDSLTHPIYLYSCSYQPEEGHVCGRKNVGGLYVIKLHL